MALLKSSDPKLAANKKLVFDMWRTIIQGAHVEEAEKFFTPTYIQHNPNVASGRDNLVNYMKNSRPRRDIQPNITFPVISIMAEGDLVMLATVSYSDDPTKPGNEIRGHALRPVPGRERQDRRALGQRRQGSQGTEVRPQHAEQSQVVDCKW